MLSAKNLEILYEDNHLIAVYKPAGVLVQPVRSKTSFRMSADMPLASRTSNGFQPASSKSIGDHSLFGEVKEYLKKKYNKPGNVFLGIVHRLDRPVAGIVLFAKTSKGASRLSEQFRSRDVSKIYHAVVVGRMDPANGILRHSLVKKEDERIAEVSDEGKESELYYETVRANDKFSLLKIEPKTGRFHQIRVQLSESGHPIAGDTKYGFKNEDLRFKNGRDIALCATEVTFRTATTEEFKTIKIDYPAEWKEFFR
ncbi:MAG: hypothetical protein A3B99_02710 [Candidatus Yanofskybacteria bacterium RIFCSPHIGHO2_02_FULL_44_12b]|uniref:Pseudouridine synthase RsuA/RluA-like domain-containing protein n=2 Tax=Candidatus Yanofskyibacteriota TaxID=1752733 RepID=A0A1F8GKS1_9BACT|nr:MAG: pseudouridine synthase [Candidatus Yanofskybacteria bacterium GW2011_GWA2_44_9]OGN04045.1 MAG: hypothetical protein A2659_00330 [Candidatus Yanofskybacteria bacterium RIFCSPHIGHO2_01_FULL_44_24]OGN15376.1 MAG: hypothetical protein A3B99_02710 [Candidatus Yanofskybacteria bacterium RIFCSPHIGHO2_02_FULL_44_12b]OGN26002.1 MAG: hypothetical protein A2925_04710 [Candidatus Yanofskybacteria bacterium RIFCSPLOWO2_01_FULL_44_22]